MDGVMYNRQKELKLAIPKKISVVGCGGVGTWVAIDAALSGVETITLFDKDKLEYHNLNRLPYTKKDVGKAKTTILADFITERRPDVVITEVGAFGEITKELLEGFVVDCTDILSVQAAIYKQCKEKGLRYFRVGYDGNHITVMDGNHKGCTDPGKTWSLVDTSGYTIISSWAAPPQMIASMVTWMMCNPNEKYAPIRGNIGEFLKVLGHRPENR